MVMAFSSHSFIQTATATTNDPRGEERKRIIVITLSLISNPIIMMCLGE